MGRKIISSILNNANESNVIDDPESSIFFEAQALNGTTDENSTMMFPMTSRNTNSSEQVSVPGSFLQGLMNTSNTSGVVPNVTVSGIRTI